MSPEQARGQAPTGASDVYSAAATLYEARTGRPWIEPLPHESAFELRMRMARAGPYRERHPDHDGPQAEWFDRALAPRLINRFADAQQARAALLSALSETPA